MRQRLAPLVWSCLIVACLVSQPARAEKRVALVIGNDRYPNLSADQQLQKAANDARAVGDAVSRLGFEVIRGENLSRQAIVDRFDELTRRLSAGDTAFFFFAGHGVSIGGANYILPTDVPNIEAGQDIRLARAALGESDIESDLQGRGVRVAVVVLDACRNNPFKRPGVRSVGAEHGLSRIEPINGVFALYSAGLGQTALDRLDETDRDPNSVFTRVFVPILVKPGLDLSNLAIEVREGVARLAATVQHDQRPAYYDETMGRIYLAGLPAGEGQNPSPPPSPSNDPVVRAWDEAKDTTSQSVLENFIDRFGDTPYATLARARLNQLRETHSAGLSQPTESMAPSATSGLTGNWQGLATAGTSLFDYRWTIRQVDREVTGTISLAKSGSGDWSSYEFQGNLVDNVLSFRGTRWLTPRHGSFCMASGELKIVAGNNTLALQGRWGPNAVAGGCPAGSFGHVDITKQ